MLLVKTDIAKGTFMWANLHKQFLPPFPSTSFFSIETWQSGNTKSNIWLRQTTLNFMKAHLQINKFLNFLVFSLQNASEQNTDNGNTHLSWTRTQISAFCEPVKWQRVLQMFKILRDQFLNLQNRSQYQKIMFTWISCWNTTTYLLSSLKHNFKSKSPIPCLWASIKAFSMKTYQQAQQFNKPISKWNTYHSIILELQSCLH